MKVFSFKSNQIFRDHLKLNFPDIKKNYQNNSKILVEFHAWSSHHICYSYLIDLLKKKHLSNVIAYEGYTLISSQILHSPFQKLKWNIGQKLGIKNFGIYKEMGVDSFIKPKKTKTLDVKFQKFLNKKLKFKNNKDLINFKLHNIWIGDLIYDTYLKVKNKPTINIDDKDFQIFFLDAIYIFFYWFDYFKKNNVKAVLISHSTYLYGMIMRIATSFAATVYKPTFSTVYKIKKNNYTIGDEFFTFKNKFKKLPNKIKREGIVKTKKEISLLFQGKRKFGLGYNYKKKLISNKTQKKVKVMVAMHNFYDSPHVFGKMLFPDFYLWLNHLVKLSSKTEYDWYFKMHPENSLNDYLLIKSILKKNKNIKIISHRTNQNEIISMGINFVLTCFGSIGFEYAYKGITVVNACIRNPHAGFNFTHNPKNINQYDKIVLNLNKFKLKPNKKEILEFFFMRRFYMKINWLLINTKKISLGFGWKKDIHRPKMYENWVNNFDHKTHEKIIRTCSNFINSNDYRLQIKHLAN